MVTQQQGESWHVLYEGAFPRRALLEREMRHRVTLAPAHRRSRIVGSPWMGEYSVLSDLMGENFQDKDAASVKSEKGTQELRSQLGMAHRLPVARHARWDQCAHTDTGTR